MVQARTLHDAFIDGLQEAYDAEMQLTRALPRMMNAASSAALRATLEAHLEETHGHAERLADVLASLDDEPRGTRCDGIAGIIEEGAASITPDLEDGAADACLIAAGQRAEHYEMAAYGTLVAWAREMGHDQAAELLQRTLDEEKNADRRLTALARGGINHDAAIAADGAHAGSQ